MYRSRLEARWAVFFRAAGIEALYETEGFDLPSDYYLPDFYLVDLGAWFELKGQSPNQREDILARELAVATNRAVYLRVGSPSTRLVGNASMITAYRPTPSGPLSVEDTQLFAECPECGRVDIVLRGEAQRVCAGRCIPFEQPVSGWQSQRLLKAYEAAQQASFWSPITGGSQ